MSISILEFLRTKHKLMFIIKDNVISICTINVFEKNYCCQKQVGTSFVKHAKTNWKKNNDN